MRAFRKCLGCTVSTDAATQVCAECIRHYNLQVRLCHCRKCQAIEVVLPEAMDAIADDVAAGTGLLLM